MKKILDDIRVIDFGQFLAAPFCCMLLADFGAEVIRVESPRGAEDRRMGLLSPNGDSYQYISSARNKKAVSLDMTKGEEAAEIVEKLVSHADVIVQNYSPKVAQSLGITYERFKKIKPDIIMVNVSCFNRNSPHRDRLGFDMAAKAMSGTMWASGFEGEPPSREQVSYVDFGSGMLAALGAVAALHERQSSGKGQEVDISLMQTALLYTAHMIAEWETDKQTRTRVGNRGQWVGPSDLYQTKDGKWIYLSLITNPIWKRFCRFIGREDLSNDPELQNDLARWYHRDGIDPVVKDWAASLTLEEVVAAAEKIPVPYGVCFNQTEVAKELDVFNEGMMIEATPVSGGKKVPVIGPVIRMSETPMQIDPTFSAIGEHNEEIYCGLLGYSQEYLAGLKQKGII